MQMKCQMQTFSIPSQPLIRFADVYVEAWSGRKGVPQRNEGGARKIMIQLTRLNGHPLIINSDLIKLIENAPDTVISLVNGEKIVVLETIDQILERVVQFRRRVLDGLQMNFSAWNSPRAASGEATRRESPIEER
jgi:flagellar protein FlbD